MSRLGVAWVVVLFLYSVARAFAVKETLGDYGVNPWVFLAFDAGSAIPLALAQVRVIEGLKARTPAVVQRWLVILTVAFVSPYAYLMLGADRPLPAAAYWIIAGLCVALGASTFWRLRTEARRAAVTGGSGLPGTD